MKKIVILFSILTIFSGNVFGQINRSLKDTLYCCEQIDSNIKREVKDYIKRNLINHHDKGIVVIKRVFSNSDKNKYDFYISEIIKKKSLKSARPTAITMVDKNMVLLFGDWSLSQCSIKPNTMYSRTLEKRLINEDLKSGNDEHLILFDPETIKITVKNNLIVSKKELATELDL